MDARKQFRDHRTSNRDCHRSTISLQRTEETYQWKANSMSTSAKLVLADGSIYAGTAYAATDTAYGHITFDTTMSGYQHSLTNSSNINTVMMFTSPHIGNVGVNDADAESHQSWPSAVVIAEPPRVRSNW